MSYNPNILIILLIFILGCEWIFVTIVSWGDNMVMNYEPLRGLSLEIIHLASLKLTVRPPLRIGRAPKGNDRLPTIRFQVLC